MTRDCSLNWIPPKIQVQNMLCTNIVLNVKTKTKKPIFVHNMFWTCNSMNNLLSYCGLTDSKMRASDTDLPVYCLIYILCWNLNVTTSQKLFSHELWLEIVTTSLKTKTQRATENYFRANWGFKYETLKSLLTYNMWDSLTLTMTWMSCTY